MTDDALPTANDLRQVIADPLRFKQRLQIGEDAYRLLRARKTLFSLWDAGGAGWTGVGLARSTWVAGTFFAPAAPTGVLSWFGLAAPAAAVTPVGWVILAGLLAGGGYYGASRWLARGSGAFVDTIPKFINTPIDLLGAGLFDLMAPLAVRVALIDNHFDLRERVTIAEHFVSSWGYDPGYVEAGLCIVEAHAKTVRLSQLIKTLATFQKRHPDCNAQAMQMELVQFLQDIVEADGLVTVRERRAITAIEASLRAERAIVSPEVGRRVRLAAGDARATVAETIEAAGPALKTVAQAVGDSLGQVAIVAGARMLSIQKLASDRLRPRKKEDDPSSEPPLA